MKKNLIVLGCVIALAVAGLVGRSAGWFKAPAAVKTGQYVTAVTSWAKGGFQGAPLAAMPSPEQETATRTKAAESSRLEFSQLVAASKQRALAKHPDLAAANTEINSRFVFRYNYLVKDHSPRLQDPTWPESLADECAAAAQARVKPAHEKSGSPKSIVANPKKMVASSVP